MIRAWLLFAVLAIGMAPAFGQVSGCRTSPVGAVSSYCASEAFVTRSRGSVALQSFASLPACSGTTEGSEAGVSDSTTAIFGATITGGGSNHVLAYCNGTNWTVAGGGKPNTVNQFTANHTTLPSDCGQTIQMGSGSSWPLTLTLQASPLSNGFTAPCPIAIVGQASRGIKLSGFTPLDLTSPNMLWPTKSFSINLAADGNWYLTGTDGRWKIPNNTKLYMSVVGGDDTSDCLAVGNPCATFQQTLRTNTKDYYDLTAQSAFPQCMLTVQLADNRSSGVSYGLAHIAFGPVGHEGRGTICIVGNSSTPSNVVISDSGGGNIAAFGGGLNVQVSNLQIGWEGATSPTANAGVDAEDGANIWLQTGVIFGTTTAAQIAAGNNGSVTALQNFSVVGGGGNLVGNFGGRVDLSGMTVTFSNNPAYTQQTVTGFAGSTTLLSGVTWTNGGTVTGTKYFCRGATTVETDTGSGASIPGSVAGSTGTGCVVF